MPQMVKDNHSGAILFVLTPEEKKIKALEEKVETLTQVVQNLAQGGTKNE